jgi:hypothetical protein
MTEFKDKPNFVLDLDQTIISGEANEDFDHKKNKHKVTKFKFENMEDYYIIFERPHLQKFLDFIFKNFNVSVWTAASKDYALFIIDKIILRGKRNRKLDYVFFSYHCNISKKIKKGSKMLCLYNDFYEIPSYTLQNTFILDDFKKDVYNRQKLNCILAPPFEFTSDNSEQDNFLNELTDDLKTMLSNKNDIQTIIKDINKKNISKYNLK